MKTKISKQIMAKLKAIERHQWAIKNLTNEVSEHYGITELYDVRENEYSDKNGWTWAMYVDQQGNIWTAEQQENMLKDFIELKNSKKV